MSPLLVVILGVVLLLLLITVAKFNAFIAFTVVCLFVGLAMGLTMDETIEAVKKGIGDTLGFLVLIKLVRKTISLQGVDIRATLLITHYVRERSFRYTF
jgi:predicted histidine transporter YuiF (NhaC family)